MPTHTWHSSLKANIKMRLPRYSTLCTPLLRIQYYAIPFDDARVRKAVSYSIMRDVITNGVTQVGGLPAYTFAHEYTAGFDATQPEYRTWTQKERDQRPRATERSEATSNPLDFKLLYNTSESNKSIAVAIASMLKGNLGAQVELENQSGSLTWCHVAKGDFDVMRASWCGDYNEASAFLSLLRSGSLGNFARYSNDKYDAAMDSALAATSEQDRQGFILGKAVTGRDIPEAAPIYYYMLRSSPSASKCWWFCEEQH
ncbi:ABC transporter substrate-binding protein [Vibrio chagasii]|nr:ABC transporter substrate-binding protein [Vibrio chagasii]